MSDLPGILFWLTPSGVVLVSLPHRLNAPGYPEWPNGQKGRTMSFSQCRPHIPPGVTHFRCRPDEAWQEIALLPEAWGLGKPGMPIVTAEDEEEEMKYRR